MRNSLLVAVLLGATAGAGLAQPPAVVPARYGVLPAPEAFPQATPRDALTSAARAIERGKAEYLVAHLIDPRFVDARVQTRARTLEADVDRELRAERDRQRQNPRGVAVPLPLDPADFATAVRAAATERAFRLVVADIRRDLVENPATVREFRRFANAGLFADAGETSSVSLRDVKDRQVFFRRGGDRWFLEDRKRSEQPATPPATAEKL